MNPTQSDLHINAPLTNISVAWMQSADAYIADKVFPTVPVQKQSDLYWKYNKAEWRRTDVELRAPSTESPGVGWNVTTDSYFCHVYAVHKDIDDQLRANADSNFSLDRDATTFITNQMLLKRDIDWVNKYFQPGVWSTDRGGVATGPTGTQFLQWDNAGSSPIVDVTDQIISFRELTGFAPNTLVIGPYVLQSLRNHPEILDRIKYTERGIVTEDLIASLLGVERILVSYATHTTTPEFQNPGTTEDNATYSFIGNGKNALLCYSPRAASVMQPAAGYTFTWNSYVGGGGRGVKVKTFRMEHIASDRIEAEMTYDMKVIAPDLGVFWSNAVA